MLYCKTFLAEHFFKLMIIVYSVTWYQVFLSNTTNLHTSIQLQATIPID